jgi:hypothetical protein
MPASLYGLGFEDLAKSALALLRYEPVLVHFTAASSVRVHRLLREHDMYAHLTVREICGGNK